MQTNHKLRSAIIGCGQVAGGYDERPGANTVNTHAKAYQLEPATELIAITDPDFQRARQFSEYWGKPVIYDDVQKMLAVEQPDIVSICSPTSTHLDILEYCSKSANIKAVWCEKPLATDLNKALEIVSNYEKNGVILAVNYQRRWNAQMLRIKKALQDGELGSIQKIMVYYTKGVINNGSHAIDLILDWLGNPDGMEVMGAHVDFIADDPTVDARLLFNGTAVYLIGVDERQYTLFEMDILGTEGRITLKRNKEEWFQRESDPLFEGYHMLGLRSINIQEDKIPPMSHALKNIIQAINNGLAVNSNGHSALATLRVCHQLASLGKTK